MLNLDAVIDLENVQQKKRKPNTNTHQHDGIIRGQPLPNQGNTATPSQPTEARVSP